MKNRLLQLFQNNANKTAEYKIKAEADEATVYLYDPIGSWYGVSAQQFVKDIASLDVATIHLRINCPGGDVFEARAMQTALQQNKAKVIAHIDGYAASAATIVCMGADEVEISRGGFYMIHYAWTLSMGNADELRDTAALLDKTDDSIVADYLRKTGQKEKEVRQWMEEETWFSADDALAKGFVDRVYEGEKAKTENRAFDLSAYSNAPKSLLEPAAPTFNREALERRLTLFERTA